MDIRKEYQALVEEQLNEWKAYAAKLKQHSRELEAQARRKFDEQLESIRAKQANAQEYFTQLKASSEEGWAELKAKLDKSWDEMRKASDLLIEHFRRK